MALRTLLQNANTAYNTQIKPITCVTVFADFPSELTEEPFCRGKYRSIPLLRNGNCFYLRAVRCHSKRLPAH